MKKVWFALLFVMMATGLVLAAVGVELGTTANPIGAAVVATGGCDTCTTATSATTCTTATSATTAGTVTTAAQPNITSVGTLTGLTVNGVIADTALYSKASAGYPVHLTKVGADGTIYGSGTGSKLVEVGLVSATAGAGAGRMLCLSTTDGTIYSIGAGTCY